VILDNDNKSFYLPSDGGVRTYNLDVNVGRNVLVTVYFGNSIAGQELYIDNLRIGGDSFLEFDSSRAALNIGNYVYTRTYPKLIIDQIGFYDIKLGRRAAKSEYMEDGWYRISMDETREWNPPPVPEPSAYGAALLGLGLGAVVLNRRRVKKGRTASALSVPV